MRQMVRQDFLVKLRRRGSCTNATPPSDPESRASDFHKQKQVKLMTRLMLLQGGRQGKLRSYTELTQPNRSRWFLRLLFLLPDVLSELRAGRQGHYVRANGLIVGLGPCVLKGDVTAFSSHSAGNTCESGKQYLLIPPSHASPKALDGGRNATARPSKLASGLADRPIGRKEAGMSALSFACKSKHVVKAPIWQGLLRSAHLVGGCRRH